MISIIPIVATIATAVVAIRFIQYKDPVQSLAARTALWAAKAYLKVRRLGASFTSKYKRTQASTNMVDGCVLEAVCDLNGNSLSDCHTFDEVKELSQRNPVVVWFRVAKDVMQRPYKVIYSPTTETRIPPHIHPAVVTLKLEKIGEI